MRERGTHKQILTHPLQCHTCPYGVRLAVPDLEAAGKAVGLKIVAADANRLEDIEVALRDLANKHFDVVIILEAGLFVLHSPQVAAAALAMKLPTVCGYREHVVAGALISYGVDLNWCYP
jgi:ABC-type uncharacterized transport system substrate-binding protein